MDNPKNPNGSPVDYFSRESRMARRETRKQALTNVASALNKTAKRSKLNAQNVGMHAVAMVRSVLENFILPSVPTLYYSGIRSAKVNGPDIDDGVLTIHADYRTRSDVTVGFDIPLEIHDGELMEPSVILHDGSPRIIAQSTFDDISSRNTMYESLEHRQMYSAPDPNATAQELINSRLKVERVNRGMFSTTAAREAIRKAISIGADVDMPKVANPENYDAEDRWEKPEPDRNSQESDYVDPAERKDEFDLKPGMSVTLAEAMEVKERGGIAHDLPKGEKCTILRDHAGDNKSFVVRFDNGLESIVERHFLRGAANLQNGEVAAEQNFLEHQ